MKHTTDDLLGVLQSAEPEKLSQVLAQNEEKLYTQPHPFAVRIRQLLAEHGQTQKTVLERAGFSLPYGYRLLSEERHTTQRDYILRICIAAGFSCDEVQHLLQLYGMAPLYPRIPRDAVLLNAIANHMTELAQVDALLRDADMEPLR